ncbi:hypothetical protein BD289DRAFT_228716 [Coniella lustricola]|uniref:Uncharacterized protein n=1 Tax=Coniella lustricola TaxID=2025994 RepID=A0A2T3AAG1_9PEZI|nr:hypothetical protein BD289DRAFT_228716 [Coniella lustricola]
MQEGQISKRAAVKARYTGICLLEIRSLLAVFFPFKFPSSFLQDSRIFIHGGHTYPQNHSITSIGWNIYIYIYISVCVCVCMGVCVWVGVCFVLCETVVVCESKSSGSWMCEDIG